MTVTSLRSDAVRSILAIASDPTARPFTRSPEDWRDVWIYFAMVDRFANPDRPPAQAPYDADVNDFQGGTIEGLRQRLDYLEALGVGALWITPVLTNVARIDGSPNGGTYHGYGIQNYLTVDPRFATDPAHADDELRRFVDDAHARNIYVILDIVLNHAGDVFAYGADGSIGSESDYSNDVLPICWRDETGHARPDWPVGENIMNPAPDAAVFPDELRNNAYFRRQGHPRNGGPETIGDFASLKQIRTDDRGADDALIQSYQYLIARFDLDGFRVDTLKFLDPEFARVFGNAMREFALSIGKRNFFTFGEVWDSEQKIAQFIGRNASEDGDLVGVDAALDYPLFFTLPPVLKGFASPGDVARMYQLRKSAERGIISSHGEATRFFVTFLDNHDQKNRFYFSPAGEPRAYDDQLTMALGCLFALPGIPCIYYGTEQGLSGNGPNERYVREALWGKTNAFDESGAFFRALRQLSDVRASTPALRYGRFYFRPTSDDGQHFAVADRAGGVLAFSRILSAQEVLVVVNTSTVQPFQGDVIVDGTLNTVDSRFVLLFSNRSNPTQPQLVRSSGPVDIHEVDGSTSAGPAHVLRVTVQSAEVQLLAQLRA